MAASTSLIRLLCILLYSFGDMFIVVVVVLTKKDNIKSIGIAPQRAISVYYITNWKLLLRETFVIFMQEICCGEYVHARTLHFNNNNFASSYLVQVHLLRVLIGKMRIKIVSGAGGGLVVSVLAFCSNDQSQNPAEVYSYFCIMLF